MEKNLTQGNLLKGMILFAIPFLLTYFLQTLYGMVDLYIVGLYNTTEVIAAVSIGSQVMHMITVIVVGLSMGVTVFVARAVGANQKEQIGEIIGNASFVFSIVAVCLTFLLVLCVKPIVSIISTPVESVESTINYLKVCFIGIPFIVAYNTISAIFRGLGDSKSPLYFVFISCVINIFLDIFFIGYMKLGAVGAAWGTTISQMLSVVISLIYIRRKRTFVSPSALQMKPNSQILKPMLRVGVPVACQDGFIQIAFIVITVIANQRGLTDAAAVGIVEKIIGFVFLIPSTMLSTVSAAAAQNIGAGKPDRAKKTLKYSVAICTGYALLLSVVVQFIAPQMVGLFDSSPDVMHSGAQYLRSYIWDSIFAGIHFCFSGYFCACGRAGLSFLHNLLSVIFVRVPGSFVMSAMFSQNLMPMGLAAPAGSVLSVLICVIAYRILEKQKGEGSML